MNPFKKANREYRVLAIAVLFFGTGLVFFWLNSHPAAPASSGGRNAIGLQANSSAGAAGGSQAAQSAEPNFATYPVPSTFSTLTFDKNGINGAATLPVVTTCHDAFVAILLFPAAVDYRNGVNTAVYNEAFPCKLGQSVAFSIATSDIATAPYGKYYLIVADEGMSGTWYNPR